MFEVKQTLVLDLDLNLDLDVELERSNADARLTPLITTRRDIHPGKASPKIVTSARFRGVSSFAEGRQGCSRVPAALPSC